MTKLLTFGNIASAVTFLSAGFGVGIYVGGKDQFDEGRKEGRRDLAVAETALDQLATVTSAPAVTQAFTQETRDRLNALSAAVAERDYEEIDRLLPFELAEEDRDACTANDTPVTVSAASPVARNCETGRVASFVPHNANRVDATMDGTLMSLAPSGPKSWTFDDGGRCTLSMLSYGQDGEGTASVMFQNCQGG